MTAVSTEVMTIRYTSLGLAVKHKRESLNIGIRELAYAMRMSIPTMYKRLKEPRTLTYDQIRMLATKINLSVPTILELIEITGKGA